MARLVFWVVLSLAILAGGGAYAQNAGLAPSATTRYLLTTALLLAGALSVLPLAAAVGLRELSAAGMRNADVICVKTAAAISLAFLAFWAVGHSIMYHDVAGYFGTPERWRPEDDAPFATGLATSALWVNRAAFAGAAALVTAGILGPRIRLASVVLFLFIFLCVLYPAQGAWSWGGGWLAQMGFRDYGGAVVVHASGGMAAAAGLFALWVRRGLMISEPTEPEPVADMLGMMLFWMAWLVMLASAYGDFSSVDAAAEISLMLAKANIAVGAAVAAALLAASLSSGRVTSAGVMNAAAGALVAISADPFSPNFTLIFMIGAVAGVLTIAPAMIMRDSPLGERANFVAAHLGCGVWGAMVVPFSSPETTFAAQTIGVASVLGFMAGASMLVWLLLAFTIGVKAKEAQETTTEGDEHVDADDEALHSPTDAPPVDEQETR